MKKFLIIVSVLLMLVNVLASTTAFAVDAVFELGYFISAGYTDYSWLSFGGGLGSTYVPTAGSGLINGVECTTLGISDSFMAMLAPYHKNVIAYSKNSLGHINIIKAETPDTYTDQTFDLLSGRFSDPSISENLPVYYKFTADKTSLDPFVELVPIELSEGYSYDLEVYPYGIIVTAMESANYTSLIEHVKIEPVYNYYERRIAVTAYFNTEITGPVYFSLTDEEENVAADDESNASGTTYVNATFFDLPNIDKTYYLTVRKYGSSDMRTYIVKTEQTYIETAYLSDVDWVSESLYRRVTGLHLSYSDGTTGIVPINENSHLNEADVSYYESNFIGSFIFYERNEAGEVLNIREPNPNPSHNPNSPLPFAPYSLNSVVYDAGNCRFLDVGALDHLPIFQIQMYSDAPDPLPGFQTGVTGVVPIFVPCDLSDEYEYNLTVYENAVLITGVISMYMGKTIAARSVYATDDFNGIKTISVNFNLGSGQFVDGPITVILFDENHNQIAIKQHLSGYEGLSSVSESFTGLPNADATYYIECVKYSETNIARAMVKTKKINLETKIAYLYGCNNTGKPSNTAQLDVFIHSEGYNTVETISAYGLNGSLVYDHGASLAELKNWVGQPIAITIDDQNKVWHIETPVFQYTTAVNQAYNEQTGKFTKTAFDTTLPIFYKNIHGVIDVLHLSSGFTYTVEGNNLGLVISDMQPKAGEASFYLGEINNNNGLVFVSVYSLDDLAELDYTLVVAVYDSEGRLLSTKFRDYNKSRSFNLDFSGVLGIDKVKAFMWTNITSMKPIGKSISN